MAEQTKDGSEAATGRQHSFSVIYRSPTNEPFEQHVTIDTRDKAAHLRELRKVNKELQAKINEALTLRMDEDKARGAQEGSTAAAIIKKAGLDEAQEEDNYGEEVLEVDG